MVIKLFLILLTATTAFTPRADLVKGLVYETTTGSWNKTQRLNTHATGCSQSLWLWRIVGTMPHARKCASTAKPNSGSLPCGKTTAGLHTWFMGHVLWFSKNIQKHNDLNWRLNIFLGVPKAPQKRTEVEARAKISSTNGLKKRAKKSFHFFKLPRAVKTELFNFFVGCDLVHDFAPSGASNLRPSSPSPQPLACTAWETPQQKAVFVYLCLS